MECIRQKYQEREHTPYWMSLFLCSPYYLSCQSMTMDWSVFFPLFHYSRTITVSYAAQRHFEPRILEDNAGLASCFSVIYCCAERGFQPLETCKFCVLTHLWWRCSPPGLIPHRAIYKSPVISFKEKAHTMIRTAQAKQYLRRTLYMIIILYRMHESE